MPSNNAISKYDWQYIISGLFLISVFIFTDLIRVFDKEFFYYVPRLISDQPYRIFIIECNFPISLRRYPFEI